MTNSNSNSPAKRRVRNSEGQFHGNPVDPTLNEAWESKDVAEGLEKTVKYTVKSKVTTTTNPTAGQYGKRKLVRPTFGSAHTTTY